MSDQVNTVVRLDLESAKEVWDTLLSQYGGITPFCTFEWYKAWVETFGKDSETYILHSGNTLVPFIKTGSTVSLYPKSTDYLDALGDKNDWDTILSFLSENGITEAVLEKLAPDSKTVSFFKEYLTTNPDKGTIITEHTTPTLTLPQTFEEYLATIKEKRRKYKKFINENPAHETHNSTNPGADINTLLSLMNLISFKKESSTPIRDEFFRRIANDCSKYIWMQYVTVNNSVIASQIMFTKDDEAMLYISGHDGESYPNVGTFLIITAIKESIEKGFKKFNFLNGDRSYKYELGAVDVPLYKVTLHL